MCVCGIMKVLSFLEVFVMIVHLAGTFLYFFFISFPYMFTLAYNLFCLFAEDNKTESSFSTAGREFIFNSWVFLDMKSIRSQTTDAR